MILSPSTYLEIFQFSEKGIKTNQNNLKLCLVLDLEQFSSFEEECQFVKLQITLRHTLKLYLHRCFRFVIRRMVPNCKTNHIICFFAFSGNCIIRFSGNEFSQDCSGLFFEVSCLGKDAVLELWIKKLLTNQIACSFSLATWLFIIIIIVDILSVLVFLRYYQLYWKQKRRLYYW